MSASVITQDRIPASRWALRQLVWAVRREIWQNRSILIVPAATAALLTTLAIFGISKLSMATPIPASSIFRTITEGVAKLTSFASFLTACAYAVNTFYNERKDLSILFWKSLPVSDAISVAAKVAIVLVVSPALTFVLNVITQSVLTVTLAAPLHATIGELTQSQSFLTSLWEYALYAIANALWWLPVYAILFVLSAVTKSHPSSWVGGILLAIATGGTLYPPLGWLKDLVWNRFFDFPGQTNQPLFSHHGDMTSNTLQFHTAALGDFAPGFGTMPLWYGVAVGLVLLVASIWLRRRADPI